MRPIRASPAAERVEDERSQHPSSADNPPELCASPPGNVGNSTPIFSMPVTTVKGPKMTRYRENLGHERQLVRYRGEMGVQDPGDPIWKRIASSARRTSWS